MSWEWRFYEYVPNCVILRNERCFNPFEKYYAANSYDFFKYNSLEKCGQTNLVRQESTRALDVTALSILLKSTCNVTRHPEH